jgi:outer membrane protein OmpA-like peptidoglycan-associated protein
LFIIVFYVNFSEYYATLYLFFQSNNFKNIKSINMSFNLIDAAKSLFSDELVSKAGSFLGESETGISKAITGVLPAVLSGLLTKTANHEGAGAVAQMVGEQVNSVASGNPNSFFGDDSSNLLNKGAGLLSGLFGHKLDGITGLISNFSGIKPSSSASLLSMAVPAVLGLLGKHSNNGGASGIAALLSSQKDNIAAAMPSGLNLSSVLGNITGSVSNAAADAKVTAIHYATETKEKSGSAIGFLLPLLLLTVAAMGAWYLFGKGCSKDADTVKAITAQSVDSAKHEVVIAAVEKESLKVKLANGIEIDAYKGGIEDKLVAFLNTDWAKLGADSLKKIWFDFDNLNFETGKSVLLPESEKQLDNLAAILKAYPAAKAKIGGYTDKVGNEAANITLSGERANAAKIGLEKRGAGAQIVGAEGYGSAQAKFAADAPESDRVKDRHVSLSIRQ